MEENYFRKAKEIMNKMKKQELCSFKIELEVFKAFLKYLKSAGIDSSGSRVVLISDCILRFDGNKMWSIVTDERRNLIAQIKAIVSDVENPVPIPIEIAELEKWLKTFKNGDIIEVLYEKGIVRLKNVTKKDFLDFDLHTDMIFTTKREDTISCDLITTLEYGNSKDKENLKHIEEFRNSIYRSRAGNIELFFGSKLTTNLELSSRQLKKIISDGERIENREYPFEFQKKKLKITIKSGDVAKKQKISRDLYAKKYNVPEPFTVTFSNRLTNAVNNISGYVKLYADKDSPMLIKTIDTEEKGLEVAYLITSY